MSKRTIFRQIHHKLAAEYKPVNNNLRLHLNFFTFHYKYVNHIKIIHGIKPTKLHETQKLIT